MTTTLTPDRLAEFIATLPGGVLTVGPHNDAPGAGCCILEAVALARGEPKTNNPDTLGLPDVRALNDAPWSSDVARTRGMMMLAPMLCAWPTWDAERRAHWLRLVVLRTVRELVPIALRVCGCASLAETCTTVQTLRDAKAAVDSIAVDLEDINHSTMTAFAEAFERSRDSNQIALSVVAIHFITEAVWATSFAISMVRRANNSGATFNQNAHYACDYLARVASKGALGIPNNARDDFLNLACSVWAEG
jgi:hypothetical protein